MYEGHQNSTQTGYKVYIKTSIKSKITSWKFDNRRKREKHNIISKQIPAMRFMCKLNLKMYLNNDNTPLKVLRKERNTHTKVQKLCVCITL